MTKTRQQKAATTSVESGMHELPETSTPNLAEMFEVPARHTANDLPAGQVSSPATSGGTETPFDPKVYLANTGAVKKAAKPKEDQVHIDMSARRISSKANVGGLEVATGNVPANATADHSTTIIPNNVRQVSTQCFHSPNISSKPPVPQALPFNVESLQQQINALHSQLRQAQQLLRDQANSSPQNNSSTSYEASQASNNNNVIHHRKIYDLPDFSGNVEDWPMFLSAFESSTATYQYNNFENCLRLQKALKGDAKEAVRSLLIYPENVQMVVDQLKSQFGRPDQLIRLQLQKLDEIAPISESAVDKLIPFSIKTQNLSAFLMSAKAEQHIANPTLMEKLVQKLPISKRLEWAQYAAKVQPYPTVVHFNSWLQGVADLVRSIQYTSFERPDKRKVVLHTSEPNSKTNLCCLFCRGQHKLLDCRKFKSLCVNQRWREAKKLKLCFACLGSNHSIQNCTRRIRCSINNCPKFHHKLLHETESNHNLEASMPLDQSAEPVLNVSVQSIGQGDPLFKILPVVLSSGHGSITTYALLDEGSSVTLLDSSIMRELSLHGRRGNLNLSWYGGKAARETAQIVDVKISDINKKGTYDLSQVYCVQNLKLPRQSIDIKFGNNLKVPLEMYHNVQPKLLIGLDHCHLTQPDTIIPVKESGPFVANTPLGWVAFGPVNDIASNKKVCLLTAQEDTLNEIVTDYFENENLGVKAVPLVESADDMRAKEILANNTRKIGNRYQCSLLWREDNVELPNNYDMALRRFHAIERKMRDKDFGVKYKKIIEEYIQKGYMRELSQSELNKTSTKIWYLPHFAVVNPNKPDKMRMVLDAAATYKGVSLNAKLLKGPQANLSLLSVLFNFRIGFIAVCADIKQMFHQILTSPEDRVSQRLLWRDEELGGVKVYEMAVMIFGAACSPCIAQYVKNSNALLYQNQYSRAVKSILCYHYVDDFVDSFPNRETAIEVAKQVRMIHSTAGFELRNFTSNDSKIVEEMEGIALKTVSFSKGANDERLVEKILGMFWHPDEDSFRYECRFHYVNGDVINGRRVPTKRELLSVVMSIFDPLGFLSHFMITAKLLMREVWRLNVDWDVVLPKELHGLWNNWRSQLANVTNFRIPRHYFKLGSPDVLELHIFADASEDAYGAVAYWRSVTSDGRVEVSITIAKSRCAPMKPMTIPRLELQAAVLATRLMCTIKENHELRISRCVFWTDSATVISWVRSESRRYKPFVAHRIAEILESSRPADWRWLPTNLNVADETTRAKSTIEFSTDSRWLKGPGMLYKHESEWPNMIKFEARAAVEEELRPKYTLTLQRLPIVNFERFSTYNKLKRTIAWVLRFIKRCQKVKLKDSSLTVSELKEAEIAMCRLSQFESFREETSILKDCKNLPKSSELHLLMPYIDEEGLMRVHGRIDAATFLPIESRRPIILSGKHPLSNLIVNDYHCKMKHQNFELTVAEIRRMFWICGLRRCLKTCVSRCNYCKLRKAKPDFPVMGPLPKSRVTPFVRPFSYVGIDYFGPMTVTIGRRHEKRWVALFTCLSSRAIHLEIAYDLSTDACIIVLRNFINRRGCPVEIVSDNGKNFVGANGEAKKFSEVFDNEKIKDELSSKGVRWQFNCPSNPSQGGIWERMVQCVKKILKVTLHEVSPKEHTLQSFLIEAEGIINSRPLTHVPVTHEDEEVLTPNHFLLGTANCVQTPSSEGIGKPNLIRKQWRISMQLRDHFWKRWILEYLPTLTRRSKWCEPTKPMEVGTLVLICDPGQCYREWKRGKVEEVIQGNDGVVRQVLVRTSSGKLKRPVSRLAVIDVNSES